MNIEDLKKIISKMSRGTLGAFGEYIITRTLKAQGYEVTGPHGDLKDFFVDGVRTDSKSRRHMPRKTPLKHRMPPKQRVKDTDYLAAIPLRRY